MHENRYSTSDTTSLSAFISASAVQFYLSFPLIICFPF